MPLNSPNMHLCHYSAHSIDLYQALSASDCTGASLQRFWHQIHKEKLRTLSDFQQVFQNSTGQNIYLEMKQHNYYNSWHGDSTLMLLKQFYSTCMHLGYSAQSRFAFFWFIHFPTLGDTIIYQVKSRETLKRWLPPLPSWFLSNAALSSKYLSAKAQKKQRDGAFITPAH